MHQHSTWTGRWGQVSSGKRDDTRAVPRFEIIERRRFPSVISTGRSEQPAPSTGSGQALSEVEGEKSLGMISVTMRLRPTVVPMTGAVTHPSAPPRTARSGGPGATGKILRVGPGPRIGSGAAIFVNSGIDERAAFAVFAGFLPPSEGNPALHG